MALPLSISAWALLRLAALIVPKVLGQRRADRACIDQPRHLVQQLALSSMSAVSNIERVNISSQCTDTLLRLNSDVERPGSSIKPKRPCGAISSTISSRWLIGIRGGEYEGRCAEPERATSAASGLP